MVVVVVNERVVLWCLPPRAIDGPCYGGSCVEASADDGADCGGCGCERDPGGSWGPERVKARPSRRRI